MHACCFFISSMLCTAKWLLFVVVIMELTTIWGVGVTRQFLLEKGFWENGVQQGNVMVVDACVVLSYPKEGISVPRTLGKCSLRYHSLNDDGSVTKAWLVSSLSRWRCRRHFAMNASLRGRDISCELETGSTTVLTQINYCIYWSECLLLHMEGDRIKPLFVSVSTAATVWTIPVYVPIFPWVLHVIIYIVCNIWSPIS